MRGTIILNRPTPLFGPEYYKSYTMAAPVRTHWRPASCEEYECEQFQRGFVTTVDVSTDLGQKQFHYLSHDRSRLYHMQRVSLTVFKFVYGPGNNCFNQQEHFIPIGRPPHLLVVGGDWRGNPRRDIVRHTRVEHWVEDSAIHLNNIAEVVRRG
jgi:hypothetical protein